MKRHQIQHKEEVEQLLQRFMDGTSTLEEEAQLAVFFRTHEVAGEWREYKEMFALFDAGEVELKVEKKRASRWKYVSIAAAVALLLSLGFFFYRSLHTEKSNFIAKTDTIQKTPQTEPKQVEERPQRKEGLEEKADTVNKAKEIRRIVHPPKTYMAKQKQEEVSEPVIRPQMIAMGPPMEYEGPAEEVASEPTIIDSTKPIDGKVAIEYAWYSIQSYSDYFIPSTYEDLERAIQERGERLHHSIELAISGEDY